MKPLEYEALLNRLLAQSSQSEELSVGISPRTIDTAMPSSYKAGYARSAPISEDSAYAEAKRYKEILTLLDNVKIDSMVSSNPTRRETSWFMNEAARFQPAQGSQRLDQVDQRRKAIKDNNEWEGE